MAQGWRVVGEVRLAVPGSVPRRAKGLEKRLPLAGRRWGKSGAPSTGGPGGHGGLRYRSPPLQVDTGVDD